MKRKLLLEQDDCAPDSMLYFLISFEKIIGCSLNEFKKKSQYKDKEICCCWFYDNLCLEICADDPYYKLFEIYGEI